ncbi:hypothetical protein [Dyella japonica]|uniref:Uncharacterized protein n=1 Tax=Dyella japonica TaxID=231455 RepID=A0ABV2JPB6_9GAMM
MPKPALDFYQLFVLPAWMEYQLQPKSLRHAMVLAIGLHHLADYVAMESYAGSEDRSAMTAATTEVVLGWHERAECGKLIEKPNDIAPHRRNEISLLEERLRQRGSGFLSRQAEHELGRASFVSGPRGPCMTPCQRFDVAKIVRRLND